MKKILFTVLLSFGFSDALNVQLLSFLPYDEDASDITGFAQDGREFAVMGLTNGSTFVDVTDPYNPFEVGYIPGSNSVWKCTIFETQFYSTCEHYCLENFSLQKFTTLFASIAAWYFSPPDPPKKRVHSYQVCLFFSVLKK